MRHARNFLFLCLPLLATAELAAASAKPPLAATRPTAADRYAVVKQRIDALLAQRTDPTPFPADSPNPFQLTPDAAATAPALAPPRVDLNRPLTDVELLPRLAAGLRIGGVVELGDSKPRVILNQHTYREGDTIAVVYRERELKLVLKSVTSESLIFGLNEAELAVRLKKPR